MRRVCRVMALLSSDLLPLEIDDSSSRVCCFTSSSSSDQGMDSPFMKAFYDKGRVSSLLKSVPVYAVLVEDIGLRGAHFVASRVS